MAILSQRKAIEGFILSQDNQKYIEKMGWFAYSLQEVLSYLIVSPRCLYDGLCCLQGHTKTSKEQLCKLSEGRTDAVSGSLLLPCLIDRCKIHRRTWYGLHIALDGFKMGSRWPKMGSRWPQDAPRWPQAGLKMAQNMPKTA